MKFAKILNETINNNYDINDNNVNNKASQVIGSIAQALDNVIPITKSRVKHKWESKKWFDSEIKELIEVKNEIYKKAKEFKVESYWSEYKKIRNKLTYTIKKKKREYNDSQIDKNKNDSKKLWKNLKEVIGKKKVQNIIKSINFDGKICDNNVEIANNFNKYFIDSISEINSAMKVNNSCDILKIDEIILKDKVDISNCDNRNFDFNKFWTDFDLVSIGDVKKIVKELKSKATTEEGINAEIFKQSWPYIDEKFVNLINLSLQTGEFPTEWKNSLISPIQKVNNTKNAAEFRPINVLPMFEKIIEKIVYLQLMKFIDKNKILIPEQSGFRENHSCETALQNVINEWKQNCDKKEKIGVVFLDFKRAFETIDRVKLILKLSKYGIKNNVLKWFASYLTDRTQQVKFNSTVSSKMKTEFGVPQGSILGPILFLLYINDLKKVLKTCDCRMFADDTIIYYSSKNSYEIEKNINKDLINLTQWLKDNMISLNVAKTKFVLIRGVRTFVPEVPCEILIGENKIECVDVIKYLGVMIDKHLNFREHVNYLIKKINKKVNFLFRIGDSVSVLTRVTIYKSIISPHFDYCSTILLDVGETEMQMLQRAQNRAMRAIIRCNRYTPIRAMLDALNFMNVKQRLSFNSLILIHKMKNDISPKYLTKDIKLISERHNYNTRQKNDIQIQKRNQSKSQHSLLYNGFKLFNELPTEMKIENSLLKFKRLAKDYAKQL